jgi:hypothetical protein
MSAFLQQPHHNERLLAAATIIKGKLPAHVAGLGGYQAPVTGELKRGVAGKFSEAGTSKRAREVPETAATDPSAQEEIRRRDEARKRVQQRTAAAFGLQ